MPNLSTTGGKSSANPPEGENIPPPIVPDLPAVPGSDLPDMRARAVSLAGKGYPVLRLEYDAKRPRGGGRGFHEATDNPDAAYSNWSDCFGEREHWNIGIRGKGLLILDFDPKNGQDNREPGRSV
jgi:hypothetical protein